MTDYFICGWRVSSAVPLPGATPWTGDDRAPDVVVRIAGPLSAADRPGRLAIKIGEDRVCRMEAAGLGRLSLTDGREIVVEPSDPVDMPRLQGVLLGPVLGLLCHQRGGFPLHAACVRIGDAAIALCGRSGTGKSTLAAALLKRGHKLVADDVSAVELAERSYPRIRPGPSLLKLHRDAATALAVPTDGASVADRKYQLPSESVSHLAAPRLRVVYLIERSTDFAPGVASVAGGRQVVASLVGQIYRRHLGYRLGRKAGLLGDALRLAATTAVFSLKLPADLGRLGEIAALIEAHQAALPS